MRALRQTLSNGSVVTLHTQVGLTGNVLFSVDTKPVGPSGSILWNGPGSTILYLLTDNGGMHRIDNRAYDNVSSRVDASLKAIAFFVDSAEATIAYASQVGINVSECYA